MHIMTKVTLGLGSVLFLISVIAIVMGGAELDSAFGDLEESSVGNEQFWTGDTSTDFNGKLKWDATYYVFVEDGYEIDVDVSDSGYFTSCEVWGDCDLYDVIPGYYYIGDIGADTTGSYEIDFSETQGRNVDVKITEEEIPVGGILGLGGGCCGICGALLLLIIGGILALTLKDQTKVQTTIEFDNGAVDVDKSSIPEESKEWWEE